MTFRREVVFEPAFDKRHTDPEKNYGIGGVVMKFFLVGPAGTIQFVTSTGWHLPRVVDEGIKGTLMAYDIGYHSPKSMYEGQTVLTTECELVEGGTCYYDGSGLQADAFLRILIEQGSDALWAALEKRYHVWLGGGQ